MKTMKNTHNTQASSPSVVGLGVVRGYVSYNLTKLKHFLVFGVLTLSLNVTSSGNVQAFDKAAYLDLNQTYTQNHQPVTKEENTATTLLKEVFSSARNTLGGTNADNTNQLGNKITDNLKDKLESNAVSETESFINTQANEFANSFGDGKTEISIRKIESNKPDYSINTIQPLTELNEDSTELTFIQAQLNSGENHGERRATVNLGIGYRALLEQGQSIVGINLFTDYETKSKHKRASTGLEYQRANFSANVNKYYPLSDKTVIGEFTEEPLSGYDIRLTGQVPYLPWAKIKATRYQWDATDHIDSKDITGTILGFEVSLNPSTTIEFGTENNNGQDLDSASYFRLRTDLQSKGGPANFAIANQAFSNSSIVTLTDFDRVERSNKIRVERSNKIRVANVIATVTNNFSVVVIGTQTWSASNISLVPTANNVLGTDYWNAYAGSGGSAADEDGYYYTWDAAMNVCPSGWRLPSDSDWKVLEGQLGMSAIQQDAVFFRGTTEGTKLKVGGSSGFEAKLAGYRDTDGGFYGRGDYTLLWSSTVSGGNAYGRYLDTSEARVHRDTLIKADGFSVRCLKD